MVVLFTPQHLHVGGLWYDPIYIISMVHMSGDNVTRHVRPRSSELDPDKNIVYRYPNNQRPGKEGICRSIYNATSPVRLKIP